MPMPFSRAGQALGLGSIPGITGVAGLGDVTQLSRALKNESAGWRSLR